jgi:hypothetical protein
MEIVALTEASESGHLWAVPVIADTDSQPATGFLVPAMV